MPALRLLLAMSLAGLSSSCVTARALHDRRAAEAQDAVAALRAARFDDAEAQSAKLVAADPENATAHAVAAIALYRRTLHELVTHAVGFVATAAASAVLNGGFIDTGYLDFSVDQAESGLAQVAAHLHAARTDPHFALELCLACWEVDWNRSGEIDERDHRLLELEVDADLQPLPLGDPRRRPTFHFDLADVAWLEAMVSFQRAAAQLVRAYEWGEAGRIAMRGSQRATLHVRDKARVTVARTHLLAGLAFADQTRLLVLAETDDDREWLPNPRQHQHPLPFPVDDALFETWAGVLEDVRELIEGRVGLSVREVALLGKHRWEGETPPGGFIDVARMLDAPSDIVLDERQLRSADSNRAAEVERGLADLFGSAYRREMRPSRLIGRLSRMKSELDRGEDRLERKLRYLFWLN